MPLVIWYLTVELSAITALYARYLCSRDALGQARARRYGILYTNHCPAVIKLLLTNEQLTLQLQSGHNTQGTSLPRIFNDNRFVQFVIVSLILSRVTHAFHFASLQRVIRDMVLVNEKYSVLELSLLKLVTPDIYSTHKIVGPLYTRYPIVARALGLAFRPSARASKGILHTSGALGLTIQLYARYLCSRAHSA